MKNVTLDFLLRVFKLGGWNYKPDFWWRTDKEYSPVTIFIGCNDLFSWASADCEELTPENINVWEGTYAELDAIIPETPRPQPEDKEAWDAWQIRASRRYKIISCTDSLFCARIAKMRPQGACYKSYVRELWQLFDACGPEREVGFGNTKKPDKAYGE